MLSWRSLRTFKHFRYESAPERKIKEMSISSRALDPQCTEPPGNGGVYEAAAVWQKQKTGYSWWSGTVHEGRTHEDVCENGTAAHSRRRHGAGPNQRGRNQARAGPAVHDDAGGDVQAPVAHCVPARWTHAHH